MLFFFETGPKAFIIIAAATKAQLLWELSGTGTAWVDDVMHTIQP